MSVTVPVTDHSIQRNGQRCQDIAGRFVSSRGPEEVPAEICSLPHWQTSH